MPDTSAPSALLDRLLARLDPAPSILAAAAGAGPGGASSARLEALLAELTRQEGTLDAADLALLLGALLARMGHDSLGDRAALARAQFAARHAQERLSPLPDRRLSGEARVLGALFAEALGKVPRWHRAGLFDGAAYLAAHPDVADAGADPFRHYVASGGAEGRDPGHLSQRDPEALAHLPRSMAALLETPAAGFVTDFPPDLRTDALAHIHRDIPRISVIVPCWNRADLVQRAVASALVQSLAPAEVIVIDDGSTDGNADRLEARFPEALEAGRLRLLRRPHEGVAATRNAGLEAATGDTIAYLDSDNTWEVDHLLFACAGMRATGAAMAYTALNRHHLTEGWSDILWRRFDRAALEEANYIDLNALVHDRALTERHGGFDTGLTRLVDWDLALRLSADHAPVAVPVVTVQYLLAPGLLTSITSDEPAEPNLARIRARQGGEAP